MSHERPGTLGFPLAVQNRTTCKPVREHGKSSVLFNRFSTFFSIWVMSSGTLLHDRRVLVFWI